MLRAQERLREGARRREPSDARGADEHVRVRHAAASQRAPQERQRVTLIDQVCKGHGRWWRPDEHEDTRRRIVRVCQTRAVDASRSRRPGRRGRIGSWATGSNPFHVPCTCRRWIPAPRCCSTRLGPPARGRRRTTSGPGARRERARASEAPGGIGRAAMARRAGDSCRARPGHAAPRADARGAAVDRLRRGGRGARADGRGHDRSCTRGVAPHRARDPVSRHPGRDGIDRRESAGPHNRDRFLAGQHEWTGAALVRRRRLGDQRTYQSSRRSCTG